MKFHSPLPLAAVFSFFVALLVVSPAQSVTIVSSTHPALISHDFTSEIPFIPYKREGGVASGATFSLEGDALTITNAHAGSFGINTKTPAFDAAKFAHIYFDYLLPPTPERSKTVRVNIFFRLKGSYHGARFTGPEEVRPGSVFLGTIADVQADGKWHRAHIPLRDWLRKLYPREEQLPIEEVIIGNWDNTNYLMAGIGGNGTGATWKMDNFAVAGVGPGQAKFEIRNDAGAALPNPTEYSYTLDNGPATPLKASELTLTATDGYHLLRIFDKAKKQVANFGFFVAESGPRAAAPQLVNNTVRVPIDTPAGLQTKSVKLTIGGRSFESDSPYLVWDGTAGVLKLEAAQAGFGWKDGERVAVVLEGVEDLLGRTLSTFNGEFVVRYAAHKATPPLPQIVELKPIGSGTFEETLDEWAPREGEGAAIVERDGTTAASGKYSVRLTSPTNSSSFGAWIRRTPFDAAKFPIIEFDYKMPSDVRVDLLLRVGGQNYAIGFTDRTPGVTRIGQIENVQADDTWRHARVDLLAMLQKARPSAAAHEVEWLAIGDTGWLGNARGLQYWIDNFQLVPIVKGTPYSSRVTLPDITGVKALSWVVDDKPDTVAPAVATATSDAMQITGSGHRWLHLRAQNGAGQWSETLHVPLALDAAPPQVGQPQPQNNTKAAPLNFEIDVSDDIGLDTSSIALTLQGKQFSVSDDALSYNSVTRKLSLDLGKAVQAKQLPAFDNNSKVAWKLAPVRDQAGQASAEKAGEWTYDYALDKTAPTVTVSSPSHSSLLWRDFEDGAGDVQPTNAKLEVVDGKELMGGSANKVLRILPTAAKTPMAVRLTRSATNLNTHNLIGFHYKLSPQAQVALRLNFNNQVYHVKIAGDAPDTVGEFAGIVADDKWHWAQFDLKPIIGKLRAPSVPTIELADPTGATPVDAAIEIDNFIIQQGAPGAPRLAWSGSDISGIAKYRFVWDQNPAANPTEETTETSRNAGETSGLWWAGVQAQDNAGNWSDVSRLPIIVQ